MTTIQLIIAAMVMWGLASFILVVFASMLSSRISQEEEMRSLSEQWRASQDMEVSVLRTSHEMAETH